MDQTFFLEMLSSLIHFSWILDSSHKDGDVIFSILDHEDERSVQVDLHTSSK